MCLHTVCFKWIPEFWCVDEQLFCSFKEKWLIFLQCFHFRVVPKKKVDVSPAKSKSPPLTDDDDENIDYAMDTYNPETYDELDYEDEDEDV